VEIEELIQKAKKHGKIDPRHESYWRERCHNEDGAIERLRRWLAEDDALPIQCTGPCDTTET
jgi:hypothetical protein